ncbi:hypothetical protein [Pseudomonas sp. Teo4]|uniref:hypothetical protein n=1 Tax=Pseudomonas sp. Teo4 TaxID=3064528 RepID=UPI002ACB14AC|nr:hypothetical protein [Pseudomonas sp. Teo4]
MPHHAALPKATPAAYAPSVRPTNRAAPSAKRVSAPLDCNVSALFTKREQLDSLKKKWRVQRGNPKRNGMYDWAVEELINTREAARRGHACPS